MENAKTEMKFFISLPSKEAYSGHPVNDSVVYTQKLYPQVTNIITDMVSSGTTNTAEVRHSLKYYVEHYLLKEKPHSHNNNLSSKT